MPGTNFHLRNPAVGSNDRALRVRGDEISACGAPEEILNDEAVRRMNDSDPVPGYFNHRRGDPETDAPAFPQVPRILLAAPCSGSGKTLVTCGILRLLQRNGFKPAAFKCGPDYIDPMFHRQVLGIPSGNLDTFFSPGGGAREILQRTVRKYGADIAVIEGVMGLFDGTGVSGMEASSWDLAAQTQTPVILVVDAKGMGRSVVPFIKGFRDYETTAVKILGKLRAEKLMNKGAEAEKPAGVGVSEETPAEKCCDGEFRGRIHGVILNRISPGMAPVMKKWIEEETGLRVAGYLPQDVSLSWGSRHLGLMQPEEVKDFRGQIDHLADILEKTLDTRILLEIAAEGSGMYDFSEKNSRQEARGAGKFTEETHRQEARRMEKSAEKTLRQEARGAEKFTKETHRQEARRMEKSAEETPRQEARRAGKPAEETPRQEARRAGNLLKETRPQIPVRIAVARDEAFNFYYEDNLELLREYGAEPVFFSPLHDTELPEADGLILGGGYPELHARALAENERMKAQIRARAAEGMPVLAECGGFMYLQESLQLPADEEQNPPAGSMESPAGSLESSAGSIESPPGSPESPPGSLESSSGSRESSAGSTDSTAGFPGLQEYAMCGVLRGTCRKTDRLVRFGYLALSRTMEDTAEGAGSGYLPAESAIRGHEFHYFDSTHNGSSCTAVKPDGKRSWKCMVIEGNIMAGFPHLYYRSNPAFARNFLDRCRTWAGKPGHSAR